MGIGTADILSPKPNRMWLCRCDCGERIIAAVSSLRAGNVQSCGCSKRANRNRPFNATAARREHTTKAKLQEDGQWWYASRLAVLEMIGEFGMDSEIQLGDPALEVPSRFDLPGETERARRTQETVRELLDDTSQTHSEKLS